MHYKQARRNGWVLPPPEPEIGSPSGFGRYGVFERQWELALCHECGGWFASVGAHLTAHELTPAQYRAMHGLARRQPLVSLRLSAAQSEAAAERVGTASWKRLEAARDPLAASAARDAEALRGRGATRAKRSEMAAQHLPQRVPAVKTCSVCGAQYTGRRLSCSPECSRESARAKVAAAQAARYTPLSDGDRALLQSITAADVPRLRPVVQRLQASGVSSAEIGRALGRGNAWMTKNFPRAKR